MARGDVEQRLKAAAVQGQQFAQAVQEAGQNALRQGAAAAQTGARGTAASAQSVAQQAHSAAQGAAENVTPRFREAVGQASAQGANLKVSLHAIPGECSAGKAARMMWQLGESCQEITFFLCSRYPIAACWQLWSQGC